MQNLVIDLTVEELKNIIKKIVRDELRQLPTENSECQIVQPFYIASECAKPDVWCATTESTLEDRKNVE